jgi:CHAD domain-containing protein
MQDEEIERTIKKLKKKKKELIKKGATREETKKIRISIRRLRERHEGYEATGSRNPSFGEIKGLWRG